MAIARAGSGNEERPHEDVIASITLLGALTVPAVASASQYVCSVHMVPSWPDVGGHEVTATYDTGPNCAGSYIANRSYCGNESTATSIYCASGYSYSTPELMALFERLVVASDSGQRVYAYEAYCIGGGSGCGSTVTFSGN